MPILVFGVGEVTPENVPNVNYDVLLHLENVSNNTVDHLVNG